MRLIKLSLLVCLMAVWSGVHVGVGSSAWAQEQASETRLADVTARAEREVARLIRATRLSDDERLSQTNEAAKPYWSALQGLNRSVTQMSNGAALQDETFHTGLADTIRFAAATLASHALTGAEDAAVNTQLEQLEAIVILLEHQFSKDAARLKAGGELTADEKSKLDALRAQDAQLEKRFKAIETKVKDNARAQLAIDEVRRRNAAIDRSGYRTRDYSAAMANARIVDGIMSGAWRWWGPWGLWYPEYSAIYIDIVDWSWGAVDYDWAYYGTLDAAVDDLDAENVADEVDLGEMSDFMEAEDTDLSGGLGTAFLEGIEQPTEADLADEAFGFPEDGLESLEAAAGEMDMSTDFVFSEDELRDELSDTLERQSMLAEPIGGSLLSTEGDASGALTDGKTLESFDTQSSLYSGSLEAIDPANVDINLFRDLDNFRDFGMNGFGDGFDDF